MIKLILAGDPVAQARIRVFMRANKMMTYDPQTAFKKDLKIQVHDQIEKMEWNLPDYPRVMFWFHMPIPKSMSKKDREHAIKGYLKHAKKPDVDNLIKLYLDVLTGIAIKDDNSVAIGSAVKVYSTRPRVEIYIEETTRIITMNEVWEGTWPTQ